METASHTIRRRKYTKGKFSGILPRNPLLIWNLHFSQNVLNVPSLKLTAKRPWKCGGGGPREIRRFLLETSIFRCENVSFKEGRFPNGSLNRSPTLPGWRKCRASWNLSYRWMVFSGGGRSCRWTPEKGWTSIFVGHVSEIKIWNDIRKIL